MLAGLLRNQQLLLIAAKYFSSKPQRSLTTIFEIHSLQQLPEGGGWHLGRSGALDGMAGWEIESWCKRGAVQSFVT